MKDNVYRYINTHDLNSYEKENKRLSYHNLFYKDEDMILCNNIINDYEDLELVSRYREDEDYSTDIYQYYIINDSTAKRLLKHTSETIYYHNRLDIYILGVSHYGASWDYVLTEFRLELTNDLNWYKAVKGDDLE